MELVIGRMQRMTDAFAAAITFMAHRRPFSGLPFGPMVDSISGAIRRGHYVVASENGRVVGFTFWAVTSADVARRWTDEDYGRWGRHGRSDHGRR
ncbi:hemolysin-activating ACP:hemolysin acyltransferase [Brevundimonas alba]|uniref:Hemolysin-activating ACP:hemolysin acyltransferase n=1 Tax=Brevundimonas alba TaxID=74314 RepID=A0A7X6BMR2_9CAUL|nr:hypothetical protein [Brevundimonas alba]NJC39950.1 hemolysin-activating ACP:hemolysin acyltransferase [Brevundimonas alba]